MGVRTRGLDIAINAKRQVADAAARAEAKAVIERWNEQLAASRDMLLSPTIWTAMVAGNRSTKRRPSLDMSNRAGANHARIYGRPHNSL
jgi:hypothetical protein